MANEVYCVCWKCRALIYDQEVFINHTKECSLVSGHYGPGNQHLKDYKFDYYICDRVDFEAIVSLKKIMMSLKPQDLSTFSVPEGMFQVLFDLLLSGRQKLNSSTRKKIRESDRSTIGNHCDLSIEKTDENINTCKDEKQKSSYKCPECHFVSSNLSKLKKHEKTHIDGKVECQHCSLRFSNRFHLKKHKELKHYDQNNVTGVKCKDCDYVARSECILKEHRRKHTGDLLKCTFEGCNFTSSYQRSLKTHLQHKHSTNKNKVCEICGFQTRHSTSLRRHLLNHKEAKPYKCSLCNFTGLNPAAIVHHVKLKHFKMKRYSCPYCNFKTGYAYTIRKHVERHEGKSRYSCPICNKETESVVKAKQHLKKAHGGSNYKILELNNKPKKSANSYEIFGDEYKSAFNVVIYKEGDNMIPEEKAEEFTGLETTIEERQLESEKVDEAQVNVDKHIISESFTAPSSPCSSLPSFFEETKTTSSKDRNPMLSATTDDLDDLIPDDLFGLMTDIPTIPSLNRCQSASTLMFASVSPHLVDRPLTPDFFSETPGTSFFHPIGQRNLDSDPGNLGSFSTLSSSCSRNINTSSPLLPMFMNFSSSNNDSLNVSRCHLSKSELQETSAGPIDVDSQILSERELLELS